MARIVLVRHGQTEFNRTDRFRGHIDVPLNETGLWQAERAARTIRERYQVAAVYSSPLSRAMRTAEVIAGAAGLGAQPLRGLLDFSYGEWEGKSVKEVEQEYPEQYRLYLNLPHRAQIPGGERLSAFRGRVVSAAEDVAASHPNETVVLVAHRMVCRVLACHFLDLTNADLPRVELDNASISIFEKRSAGGWVTLLLNDTCHLRSDES